MKVLENGNNERKLSCIDSHYNCSNIRGVSPPFCSFQIPVSKSFLRHFVCFIDFFFPCFRVVIAFKIALISQK